MAGSNTFKLSWQKSKQTDKNAEEGNPDAPPPYTESSSQNRNENEWSNGNTLYPVLTKFAEENDLRRRSHFHWILVDIVAITFSTDLGRLRRVLVKTDPTWAPSMELGDSSSILIEEKQRATAELCALVRYLQRELAQNRWLLIHPRAKYLARKLILEPTQELELDLDFALELMGGFERGEGCKRPERTLLGYWRTWPHTTSLGDIMASHVLILESFELEREVRVVLEDYIEAFEKENGLEGLCTSKELQGESLSPGATSCWPLGDEYMNLAKGLRTLKISHPVRDPYEASRTRLIERRSLRAEERA